MTSNAKGTALVTGASSGIGAVYADRLARSRIRSDPRRPQRRTNGGARHPPARRDGPHRRGASRRSGRPGRRGEDPGPAWLRPRDHHAGQQRRHLAERRPAGERTGRAGAADRGQHHGADPACGGGRKGVRRPQSRRHRQHRLRPGAGTRDAGRGLQRIEGVHPEPLDRSGREGPGCRRPGSGGAARRDAHGDLGALGQGCGCASARHGDGRRRSGRRGAGRARQGRDGDHPVARRRGAVDRLRGCEAGAGAEPLAPPSRRPLPPAVAA